MMPWLTSKIVKASGCVEIHPVEEIKSGWPLLTLDLSSEFGAPKLLPNLSYIQLVVL